MVCSRRKYEAFKTQSYFHLKTSYKFYDSLHDNAMEETIFLIQILVDKVSLNLMKKMELNEEEFVEISALHG